MPLPYAKPGPYQTPLNPVEEALFRHWLIAHQVPYDPYDPNPDYDMRGFFKAMYEGDPRAKTAINPNDNQIHFPDIWKTPLHKSFSRESIYALPDAPYWQGEGKDTRQMDKFAVDLTQLLGVK